MRRIAILIAVLSGITIAGYGQSSAASFFVLNCRESVRLSNSDEAILHTKCSDGKTYLSSGGGAYFEVLTTDNGGTVQSVGVSAPAEMSVTGSPITTSGTIALAWQSQLANLVLASPNASSGVPTFRKIFTLDINDEAITDVKLRPSAPFSVIGKSNGPAGAPADITASADGSVLRRSGLTLGFGTIATGGVSDNAITLAKLADIATDTIVGRDTAGTGDPEALTVGGGVEFSGSGGIQRSALTGDATASAGSNATTIAANAVTFSKLADIATDTLIGRDTAATGDPEAITLGGGLEFTGSASIQTSALTGDVTKTAGGTTTTIAANAVTDTKLRDSAALSVIGRSANSSGDPADIAGADGQALRVSGTTLGFGTLVTAAFANDAITYAKMQNVSATQRFLGRTTGGSGDVEEGTATQLFSWVGITVDGSNNIGINTTPESKLHVATSTSGAVGPILFIDNPASVALNNAASLIFGTSSGANTTTVRTGYINGIVTNAADGATDLVFGGWSGSAEAERLRLTAAGNTTVAGNLSVGGTAAITSTLTIGGYGSALGSWTTFSPTRTAGSGTWTGGTITTAQYKIENKTMTVMLKVDDSTLSAAPITISIAIPASKVAAVEVMEPVTLKDSGTGKTGTMRVQASGTTIDFTTGAWFSGTWAGSSSTNSVSCVFTFAIN